MKSANRKHPQNGYRAALAPYSVWSFLFIVVPLAFIAYYAFTDNQFAFVQFHSDFLLIDYNSHVYQYSRIWPIRCCLVRR